MRFLLRRAAQALFVIFGVACVTFFVLRLVPGDPARLMVPPGQQRGSGRGHPRSSSAPTCRSFEQFWVYLSGLVQGDLGTSFRYERPVLDLVLSVFPATLALGGVAMLFSDHRRGAARHRRRRQSRRADRPAGAGPRHGRTVAAQFLDRRDAGPLLFHPAQVAAGDRQRERRVLHPAGADARAPC